jgi:pyruvate formate-lyase activating enzyme-like uncharacterized protein
MEEMPLRLRAIYRETKTCKPARPNLDLLQPIWQSHVCKAKQRVPGIHIEAGGEIVHLGGLSPGCQACKAGTWDCIFTSTRCNLDCAFCYSPHAIPREYAGSAFGTTPEQVAENHARTDINGISFSGGEPFVEPQKLFRWVTWFTGHCPDKYYWVYTNGLLAGEEQLRRLGALGVNEVRFNMAATGYDHPTVTENLSAATHLICNVTVEIPAIPAHADKLLSCLEDWCSLGVKYLNLHELMYEPGTNSASMHGTRQAIVTADGHRSEIHPESRALTLAVMERVQKEGLPLSVNDCSLQSKLRQLRGRRRSLAPLVQARHERMLDDEVYESYCACRGQDEVRFFHPHNLQEMQRRLPDCRFVRLVRTAPLSVQDRERWIAFEILGRDDGCS